MLELQDVLTIVTNLASDHRVATERVDLLDAFHRVLAQGVASDVDLPPFRQSTRDGFACRRERNLTTLQNAQIRGSRPASRVDLIRAAMLVFEGMHDKQVWKRCLPP